MQLSEASRFAGSGTASQETVISVGSSPINVGFVVSSIVITCVKVSEVFPQSSFTVHVLV
ncbi:hypothetical protein GIY83_03300 [Flavobacterium sp. SLB02]|nr:hypothetical protein GIY83_03300 [Flavobacterium sp. SLB02]